MKTKIQSSKILDLLKAQCQIHVEVDAVHVTA